MASGVWLPPRRATVSWFEHEDASKAHDPSVEVAEKHRLGAAFGVGYDFSPHVTLSGQVLVLGGGGTSASWEHRPAACTGDGGSDDCRRIGAVSGKRSGGNVGAIVTLTLKP